MHAHNPITNFTQRYALQAAITVAAAQRLGTEQQNEAVNALHALTDFLVTNNEKALHRAAKHLWGASPPSHIAVNNDWEYTVKNI